MGDDHGAITIVAITGALILCLGALAAADLGSMLVARAHAQSAADAAALAAATAQAPILNQGDDPEQAAREAAERNGADLVRCDCSSGETIATVEVSVRPRLVFLTGWFGRAAHAEARAELDPDVLTYRDSG
ncbi:MAG: Rv3654c family TadE-like protein [Actinomycetota bacterium]